MHYGPMYRYGNMFLAWLIPFILILLIGFALYMIFRKNREAKSQDSSNTNNTESALRILNERYARGEIDEDEFKRMKNNLLDD